MSTIRKNPYIHTLIASLSKAQTDALVSSLNGSGDIVRVKLWDKVELAKIKAGYGNPAHTGISYVELEYLPDRKAEGFFIYTDSYTVLLSYIGRGPEFHITYFDSNDLLHNVDEYLDTEELRRIIDDEAEHGGDEWADRMKAVIDYDAEDQVIVASKKIEIEGQDGDGVGLVVDEKSLFENTIEVHGKIRNVESGVPHDTWFIETNQLKVNNITFQDTPEGGTPAVNIVNADIVIDSNKTIKIGNTTLSETQLQALLALIAN